MKLVFVDTWTLVQAQEGKLLPSDGILRPIIVYDAESGEHERAASVKIVGPAEMKFEMAPDHNLARVWVEAPADSLEYDGIPTEWRTT